MQLLSLAVFMTVIISNVARGARNCNGGERFLLAGSARAVVLEDAGGGRYIDLCCMAGSRHFGNGLASAGVVAFLRISSQEASAQHSHCQTFARFIQV